MRPFLLISLGLSLGLTACASDSGDEPFVISKNVAPGMGCTFSASSNELFISHGEMSLFSPEGYKFFPQMVSRLTATDTQTLQRTIELKGARIDLTFPNGDVSNIPNTSFQTRFSAPLAPNGGVTDAGFELIPAPVAAAVAQQLGVTPTTTDSVRVELIAKIVAFGDLHGDSVDSAEFEFPVTLCNDCVTNILGTCPLPEGTLVIAPTNACSAFQDGVSDCCVDGARVICPAIVEMPPTP